MNNKKHITLEQVSTKYHSYYDYPSLYDRSDEGINFDTIEDGSGTTYSSFLDYEYSSDNYYSLRKKIRRYWISKFFSFRTVTYRYIPFKVDLYDHNKFIETVVATRVERDVEPIQNYDNLFRLPSISRGGDIRRYWFKNGLNINDTEFDEE